MAQHKSAKERIRQSKRRNEINTARTSRVRSYIKKIESAIASGDKTAAQSAFKEAQPEIHRGVRMRVLHRNAAARKLSRLSARIKAL